MSGRAYLERNFGNLHIDVNNWKDSDAVLGAMVVHRMRVQYGQHMVVVTLL